MSHEFLDYIVRWMVNNERDWTFVKYFIVLIEYLREEAHYLRVLRDRKRPA
jgi:hypothetical protein